MFINRIIKHKWASFRKPFTCIHPLNDCILIQAEDDNRTKQWYTQLQYHAQGTGAWRKRRTALANIMINGMMIRP